MARERSAPIATGWHFSHAAPLAQLSVQADVLGLGTILFPP